MDETRIREIIKEELSHLIKTERITIEKGALEILDGRNIIIGTNKGTQIGGVNAKIALFGKTPIAQPQSHAGLVGFTGAGSGQVIHDDTMFYGDSGTAYSLGDIVKNLKDLGILKS